MIGSLNSHVSSFLSCLRIKTQYIQLVSLTQSLHGFLSQFSLKVHAGHSHDAVPEVVVVGFAQVADQSVGGVGAGVSEEVASVVFFNLFLNPLLVLSKFLLKYPLISAFWRIVIIYLFIFVVLHFLLLEIVLVELVEAVYLLGCGTILKSAEAIIDDLDTWTLKIFVVDGLIDVKQ